jgi:IS5 family transposase
MTRVFGSRLPPGAFFFLQPKVQNQQRAAKSAMETATAVGRVPKMVAADAGFFSADHQRAAQEKGVEKVAVPNKRTRSRAVWQHQGQRWFRRAQRWKVGCEGRISVLKRKHGLVRCRYHGIDGLERWVGLGAIANNLIQLGRQLARKSAQVS